MHEELLRLDARFSHYHLYHLIISTKKSEADEQYLKIFIKRMRLDCDAHYVKFVCYDEDGTEHLHVPLWLSKPFESIRKINFKDARNRLEPVKNGWKSESHNGYHNICLLPHNNAAALFSYILSNTNLNLDRLRTSGRHFYSASDGINTVAIQRAYRRFRINSDAVLRSTNQLETLISKLQSSQEQAESVQAFISELFGTFRDAALRRSTGWSISRYRSPKLLTPHTPTRRRDLLFSRYEYMPFSEREYGWIISNLSEFGPRFQSRLIPKLLYDMVCHSWALDPCLSMPPEPLVDFYSDDFLYATPAMSADLPFNPDYEELHLRQMRILKT